MTAKKNLEEDGVDVRETQVKINASLPPDPERFRAEKGRIQFRLKPTDCWCAVERLKDADAFIAMALARCVLMDVSDDLDGADAWREWFMSRWKTAEQVYPIRSPGGYVESCFDDSRDIRERLESGDDLMADPRDSLEPASLVDLSGGLSGQLEKNPAAMAVGIPEARVDAFAKRANGLIVEMLVRAAAEMQDKKKHKTPDAKLAWIDWAQKNLQECILEELAHGPAMEIVRYRAQRGNTHHYGDAAWQHDCDAIMFFFGAQGVAADPSLRAKERLESGLSELKRRVLGNGNGSGGA